MCRSFCMGCPELLLYWLFYDNNKRSQNVADESLQIRLLSDSSVLATFSFYGKVNMAAVTIFRSEANTAGSE